MILPCLGVMETYLVSTLRPLGFRGTNMLWNLLIQRVASSAQLRGLSLWSSAVTRTPTLCFLSSQPWPVCHFAIIPLPSHSRPVEEWLVLSLPPFCWGGTKAQEDKATCQGHKASDERTSSLQLLPPCRGTIFFFFVSLNHLSALLF